MKKYTYWDNSKTWHEKVLFEILASDILVADDLFKEKFGFEPSKKSTIGLTISDN